MLCCRHLDICFHIYVEIQYQGGGGYFKEKYINFKVWSIKKSEKTSHLI